MVSRSLGIRVMHAVHYFSDSLSGGNEIDCERRALCFKNWTENIDDFRIILND